MTHKIWASAHATEEEIKWLKKLQKILDACPSKRLGFFTIGDRDVFVTDEEKINKYEEENGSFLLKSGFGEYCHLVEKADASIATLKFPANVHSTSG
ncbi:hypothetical protein [Insolitispirillum peregrinum]|uniref:hypothetical protein n=1 Tax=Insolitispirillum peregrinum TaxID=80876 RepID=UPI00360B3D3A